jgi:hypothetical protein
MMFAIVFGSLLLLAVVGSVGLLIRDARVMHREGRSLADGGGDAAGLSAAGMVWQNNVGMR